jgi:hypothetical protein
VVNLGPLERKIRLSRRSFAFCPGCSGLHFLMRGQRMLVRLAGNIMENHEAQAMPQTMSDYTPFTLAAGGSPLILVPTHVNGRGPYNFFSTRVLPQL